MNYSKTLLAERIKTIELRMKTMTIHRDRALDKYKTKVALTIQKEIDQAAKQLQRFKIISLFY